MHNLMLFSDRVLVLCNFITERERVSGYIKCNSPCVRLCSLYGINATRQYFTKWKQCQAVRLRKTARKMANLQADNRGKFVKDIFE